ncbi:LETM1-related biofilm-associated protein [Aquimarina brevivitae]|uniref:LETM1-like protein n=1 Tax=Aquimarina brevivitae TaxID=323412 RepID=A0A4Q7P3V0_9FLAO|nr:LETM1-related biofilm-associated protein [Aquimarina brevivitae]RZS93352.1 LETM1-like protein [Aquimarina brevivitae]
MNPSSSGWIAKFLKDIDLDPTIANASLDNLYPQLKKTGFIYGNSIDALLIPNTKLSYSQEEKTKINLLIALRAAYLDAIENATNEDFIEALLEFYKYLDSKKSYFSFLSLPTNSYDKLEKAIHARIQTNESIFKKNFSHLLTNALLFIDVLAFEYYLVYDNNPFQYASLFEESITNTVFLALNSKQEKNEYDQLLVKLFASSVRYTKVSSEGEASFDHLELQKFKDPLEKQYILDLTSMAVWNDERLDQGEIDFVQALGAELQMQKEAVTTSINEVHDFIDTYKDEITFFKYSNPAQHFYNQTSRTVRLLILRNRKRLIREITESKDLMILLGQSTVRELSAEEKQRVKNQLLDICKSIPSLAIFILPGGGILLPLLIKFIPQLLPSAFNENK